MSIEVQKTQWRTRLRRLAIPFSRWHFGVFLAIWLPFTVWTFAIVSQGLDDAAQRPLLVIATTAGTVLGPMTGAISRDFQGCCLQFSLSLLPYCLSAVAVATLVQVVLPANNAWLRGAGLLIWAAGWIVWFGGGIVSFVHALS